jgi:hypothetical protein
MKHFDRTMENAESDYAAWRDANPKSFVVNEKSGEWVLHVASCSHLQQFSAFEAKLVDNPKSCSDNLVELQEHASKHNKALRRCRRRSCAPPL